MSTAHALQNAARRPSRLADWLTRLVADGTPTSFTVHTAEGERLQIGSGTPQFEIVIHNPACYRAFRSLNEPQLAVAYIRGDFDVEGDLVAALQLRDQMKDRSHWLKLWRRLAPLLFGRERFNPEWIAKHYDMGNIQFFATETAYRTYTPGTYLSDDESLESGAARKLEFAFNSLGLKAGDTLLDVGCGWGGFLRYASERGVRVTGITLSRDQHAHVSSLIKEHSLPAEVLYQDFFTFEPQDTFDAVSMMGVIEDLSDYHLVMKRLPRYLRTGGRVYLDYATTRKRFDTSSFITRYVWPGTFRLVYLPEMLDAVNQSSFELVGLYDDRHNYYLWSKGVHDRWLERKAAILERASAEQYRMLRLLYAGAAALMSTPAHGAGACRMVLQHFARP